MWCGMIELSGRLVQWSCIVGGSLEGSKAMKDDDEDNEFSDASITYCSET